MRIAFFGTSEFIGSVHKARFLHCLVDGGVRPAVVVTAPDSSEPGRESVPPAVKSAALELGLPVLQPATLKGFSEELARFDPDLALVAAYGKILPPDVLAVPKFGSVNIHPSLLPRWRGPTPIQATILAGDTATGVTIIKMDEQMDHGPIIAQREFPLGERAWTAPELSDALTDIGAELFLETLGPWTAGSIIPQPQDEAHATYSRLLKRENGHIDWARPAVEIERMVRAFQPWPGAYAFWRQGDSLIRLAVAGASSIPGSTGVSAPAGTVLQDSGLAVAAGDGVLVIHEIKPEGRTLTSGVEFLRGHPDIIGAVLT